MTFFEFCDLHENKISTELLNEVRKVWNTGYRQGREQGILDKEHNFPNHFRARLEELLDEIDNELVDANKEDFNLLGNPQDTIRSILDDFNKIMKGEKL